MKTFTGHYFTEVKKYDYDEWLNLKVYHTTETGKRNKVMIKSLSPKEQDRYRNLLRKGRKSTDIDDVGGKRRSKDDQNKDRTPETSEDELLNFYFGVKNPDNYDKIIEGKLKRATDQASVARYEFQEQGKSVVKVSNVPLDSVVQHMNDKGEWSKFEKDMDPLKKMEFIKFEENDMFLLNLFPYQDMITITLSDPEEEEEVEDKAEEEYPKENKTYEIQKLL